MKTLLLAAGLAALATAAPSKSKATARPKASAKTSNPRSAPAAPTLAQLDKICRRDQAFGKLDALRGRCADLEPRSSAIATYWRLSLADDPNDLRVGFAPPNLAKLDVDSRLLLAAGRYHFARGQVREMEDLVEIARKAKLKGREIDTLRQLAAGK